MDADVDRDTDIVVYGLSLVNIRILSLLAKSNHMGVGNMGMKLVCSECLTSEHTGERS